MTQVRQTARTNLDEIEKIGEILDELEGSGYDLTQDVGIITPYSNQKNELIKKYGERLSHKKSMKIGSVHQFQGVGFEVIIYSPVIFKPSDSDFFQNNKPNILNVAVSRAKQQFIVVGNYHKLVSSGGYLKKLAEGCAKDFFVDIEHQSPIYVAHQKDRNVEFIHNCDHLTVFDELIRNARESVTIIVPWIKNPSFHPQIEQLSQAKKRGIHVKVYYGYYSKDHPGAIDDDGCKDLIDRYKNTFGNENVIRLDAGTHEKILLIDDSHAIVGSWNWLSHCYHYYCAHPESTEVRGESSLKTQDAELVNEIITNLK